MENLIIGKKIGSGAFAEVKEAIDKKTNNKYAVKIISKAKCKGFEGQLVREIAILQNMNHPNIVRLHSVWETKEAVYMQMEYVSGGELFDRIVNQGAYTEEDARKVIFSIASAIDYLHSKGIVHRDLKPENLLLENNSKDANIKLADFGLSTLCDDSFLLETICGTMTYAVLCRAPEILRGEHYGKPVDCWSLGVISYILLCGYAPFDSEDERDIIHLTLAGKVDFDSPEWAEVSENAKDFIGELLIVDSAKRMTIEQACSHPWMKSGTSNKLHVNVKSNLAQHFNAKRKFRGGVEAVMAVNGLKKMFKSHVPSQ